KMAKTMTKDGSLSGIERGSKSDQSCLLWRRPLHPAMLRIWTAGWYSGIGGSSLVDERYRDLEKTASLQGMLGYLNFAGGKTDARFQRQLNDSYAFLAGQGEEEPWRVLQHLLRGKLETLKASDSSAFRDARQAEAVLVLGHQLLAAYQQHHADLLFHLSARDLFQPL